MGDTEQREDREQRGGEQGGDTEQRGEDKEWRRGHRTEGGTQSRERTQS